MEKANQDGPESMYYVARLAEGGVIQAVPMLEAKFARCRSELTTAKIESGTASLSDLDKSQIASALIRLGDKAEIYWDFLLQQATVAVDSRVPEYLGHDSQGNSVAGPSPEFTEWAKARHLDPAALEEEDLFIIAGPVAYIGMTGDPRAVPLLGHALESPNLQVERVAAQGLAKIQDKDSIPLIVAACEKAPAGAAATIAASSLVYFDDAEAQRRAAMYIPASRLKGARENGRRPGSDPFK